MTAPYQHQSQWIQQLWNRPWVWLVLVGIFFCAPLFIGLDRTDLDNDEAIYAFANETMVKDGDWLTPKSIPSETAPFLEKPPLKFWITYVPLRLGLLPDNEFGLRFMDAAMGALTFLYVFGIGRRLAGPICGVAACVLLFSHYSLVYEHGIRSNNMESAIVLAYAAGVYHFLAWRSVNPDVKRHVYAMALWFVFGFMTKFVAALFLPVVLGLSAVLRREDLSRLKRDWRTFIAAGVLAVALIAPWFIYQFVKQGPDVWKVMFGTHVFKRFTASLDPSHLHPWNYYLLQIWGDITRAGTRVLIAVAALLFLVRTVLRRWTDGAVVLLWFLVPMIAISTTTSKLYHYAFPFLAPIALMGGWLVAVVTSRVFRWIAEPVAAVTSRRDAILPAPLRRHSVQRWLTMAGLTALGISAATAVFNRLSLTIGTLTIRNSSTSRPAIIGAILLAAGAPQQIIRAVLVAGLAFLVLPLSMYQANVQHANDLRHPMKRLRTCMESIVFEHVSAGQKAPGAWVETTSISFIPFYYLRALGPWNQRDTSSDETVLMHLSSPAAYRPVIISTERYNQLVVRLTTDPGLIERAAKKAGIETSVMLDSLRNNPVGLTQYETETFLLPGAFVECGRQAIRLASQ